MALAGDVDESEIRPLLKARAVTVSAHFSHDGNGGLHPVTAYVRWVEQAEYDDLQIKRVSGTLDAILRLRDGKGKPPYMTTKHMRLGPIGLTFARLEHIMEQRKKRGQDIDSCMKGIAECLVHGGLKIEPANKDNKREQHSPQIWATSGKHQVTLDPFRSTGDGMPEAAWIVSGYEMIGDRPERTAAASDVEIQIVNQKEEK